MGSPAVNLRMFLSLFYNTDSDGTESSVLLSSGFSKS